ncbi:MAG: class I SAM-dependent methyltransferase [Kofleriaceae bacterium]
MIWILVPLCALFVLAAVRMRGRLASLDALPPSDQPVAADHRFITGPGVTLDEATRRAASAWATANRKDVVDLIPGDLPTIAAMSLAQLVDLPRFRTDRLAIGRTAGHAMLVSTEVAERAQLEEPADEVAMLKLAARLKQYATATTDLVVAPAARARREDLGRRRAVVRALLGPSTPVALILQPLFFAIMALGVWVEPIAGGVALGLWHLQPLVAIAGTKVRSRDLLLVTVLRAPVELYLLARTLLGRWQPPTGPDPVEVRRPTYATLATTAGTFFEPRRTTCPVCDQPDLTVHLRFRDLLQHKPGRFVLERCRGCGHIFQNPRLSIAGLDYYYKDFYDGLGEAGISFIFGLSGAGYLARARMVKDVTTPARWLDVGCGHGHFCLTAKDELPTTQFDGLDLSASVDEARRRGWIDHGFLGLFPDKAPELAGGYQVVSMAHYLEHTREPRDELAAAHTALAPGGHLLIEVPDPAFGLGKLLGTYWLPWFQPQHQHLLSVGNLERLLREAGFTPLTWHRGSAHQRVDFLFAAFLWLGRLAPPSHQPWRPRSTWARIRRGVVWTLGSPLIVLGIVVDRVITPFILRGKRSNTYRVLARRDG